MFITTGPIKSASSEDASLGFVRSCGSVWNKLPRLSSLIKSCARGGGVKRGDVCYGMLRAAACVDESDHHALMYVRHGQTVREEGVDE